MKISYFNKKGNEIIVKLPAKLQTCPDCLGSGLNDRLGFLSRCKEKFCSKCNGKGSQKIIDEDKMSMSDVKHYEKYLQEMKSMADTDLEWFLDIKYDLLMGRW